MPSATMAPQNTEADAVQVGAAAGGAKNGKKKGSAGQDEEKGGETDGPGKGGGGGGGGGGKRGCKRGGGGGGGAEGGEDEGSVGSVEGITLKRWVMHGAIMFGREFCYAMETALVTPVLLQIGLPEQYYSLTWFLSPVLGLMFTPLIGSASDRCTLPWGRRRPFILALCIGTLIGVALFLNGSVLGLSMGDEKGRQPIGIVLTVLGVVVLDFCADAAEGPIRAYLLDVADTEEQDMALNIHAASAGLGGAVGYALGGLDWTHTFLGQIFSSQEQILFVFAAILFTASVILHLFSIEEQQYSPQQDRLDQSQESPDRANHQPSANGRAGLQGTKLDLIGEDETMDSFGLYDHYDHYGDDQSDCGDMDMDFLEVELVRSKSDSVLAVTDSTLDHLDHEAYFLFHLEPSIFADRLSPYHGSPPGAAPFFGHGRGTPPPPQPPARFSSIRRSSSAGSQDLLGLHNNHHTHTHHQHNQHHHHLQHHHQQQQSHAHMNRMSRLSAFLQEGEKEDGQEALLSNKPGEQQQTVNGRLLTVEGEADTEADADPDNANKLSSKGQAHRAGMVKAASTGAPTRHPRHRHIFYRQPSCTFSYYGRVGSHRYRYRRANAALLIKSSRSMNDLYEVEARHRRRNRQRSSHRSGHTNSSSGDTESEEGEVETTVRLLWLSMLKMPPELLRLCACHLLTWFSIIAEAVFFTDFMGQVIFHGDPTAPANSTLLENYHKGVQMGCWGLVIYAMTAAMCSAILQKYLDNFDLSIKVIYILGTLAFSIGTAVMAMFPNVYVAMVMISTMGIISMSISYCPYALLGQYHEMKQYIQHSPGNSKRGFGIDCAILSCQVYISQILVASALGAVVEAVGSVRVIPMVASGGSLLGFFTAFFFVIYPTPNSKDGDSAKASEKKALTKLENPDGNNDGAVAVTIEKPSFLKLNKKGKASTTTSCHTENESSL